MRGFNIEERLQKVGLGDVVNEDLKISKSETTSFDAVDGYVNNLKIQGKFIQNFMRNSNVVSNNFVSDDSGSWIGTKPDGTIISSNNYSLLEHQLYIQNSHKYWVYAKVNVGTIKDSLSFKYSDNSADLIGSRTVNVTEYYNIITATKTDVANFKITEGEAGIVSKANVIVLDLTEMGWDSMTADEVKMALGNLDGLEGTLPSMPTVNVSGENLFDGMMELGDISSTTGENSPLDTKTRSVNYTRVKPNTSYKCTQHGVIKGINFREYDVNKSFLGYGTATNFTTSPNTHFIRFTYGTGYTDTEELKITESVNSNEYIPPKHSQFKLNDWLGDNEVYENGMVNKQWGRVLLSEAWAGSFVAITGLGNNYRFYTRLKKNYSGNKNVTLVVKSYFKDFLYKGDYDLDIKQQYFYYDNGLDINQFLIFIPKQEIDSLTGSNLEEKFESWVELNDDYIYYKKASAERRESINFNELKLFNEKCTLSFNKSTFTEEFNWSIRKNVEYTEPTYHLFNYKIKDNFNYVYNPAKHKVNKFNNVYEIDEFGNKRELDVNFIKNNKDTFGFERIYVTDDEIKKSDKCSYVAEYESNEFHSVCDVDLSFNDNLKDNQRNNNEINNKIKNRVDIPHYIRNNNILSQSGIAFANKGTDGVVQKIDLSQDCQLDSYTKTVFGLCSLDNSNSNLASYSSGSLIFKRSNGLEGMLKIDFQIEKRYDETVPNITYSVFGLNFIEIKPCNFSYEGEKYGGLTVYINAPNHQFVYFTGLTNFNIFALDYYKTTPSTVLNQEINDSINTSEYNLVDSLYFNGRNYGIPEENTITSGFSSGWSGDLKLRKTGDNMVNVRVNLTKSTDISSGLSTIYTLPSEYIPSDSITQMVSLLTDSGSVLVDAYAFVSLSAPSGNINIVPIDDSKLTNARLISNISFTYFTDN